MPITREDAVLAVQLWGLACYRYAETAPRQSEWEKRVLGTPGAEERVREIEDELRLVARLPEAARLYSGLQIAGDPVEVLEGLSAQLSQLAACWRDWRDAEPERRATA